MKSPYEQEKVESRKRKILFEWIVPIAVSIVISTLTVLTILCFK